MPQSPELPWLADLNAEQREAVTFGGGPLLVVAGAGSGKTRTLAYRVAYLIATGTAPERILLLTFTRRAAEEMTRRAMAIVTQGTVSRGRLWSGTFHAVANRLLRLYAANAGLSPDFTVTDQSDAADLMDIVRKDLGFASKKTRFPRKTTCLAIYSRCMAGDMDLEQVLNDYYPWCVDCHDQLKELFQGYVERKQSQQVLDYDDLLLYLEQILEEEELAAEIGGRFDHVLVDEYQDTNPVQARILQGLRRFNPNVMAVGDDAQSIYSFRAATIRNMLDFPEQFPGARVIKLEQNYRSTTPILKTTNAVIAPSTERFAKDLWSAREEGEKPRLVLCEDEASQDDYVIERALAHLEEGIPLHQQAVLFRAGHHSDSLEVELMRRKIPYRKYGGLRFLEAAHVKDLICFLRLAENPRDELAWFRILQLFTGVGPKSAQNTFAHLEAHKFEPACLTSFKAPAPAKRYYAQLSALLVALKEHPKAPPASQVEQIRRFYDPILKRVYDNAQARSQDIEHLEQIATGFSTRQQFLTEIVLDPPNSSADLAGPPEIDEDWLVLSTIHSAKGCEWDVVYLIHAADGNLPSDMACDKPEQLEEERRLTYVAMTRARDFLYVSWPMRYYFRKQRYDPRFAFVQLCRFLDTPSVKRTCEKVNLAKRASDSPARDLPVRKDIAAKLRNRWS